MQKAKPKPSGGKFRLLWGTVAFLLLLLAVYLTDMPTDTIASQVSVTSAQSRGLSRPAHTPAALSPFGSVICLSSDCAPVASEPEPEVQDHDLPPRTLVMKYFEQVRKGDLAALTEVRQALDNCHTGYRNRLVADTAFGISSPAQITECSTAELADLVGIMKQAVNDGFNPAHLQDSNARQARLGWIATMAQLDDSSRQLANVRKLQPDVNGTIFYENVPPPKRVSPIWQEVLKFAKEYGQSDPEILSMGEAVAAMLADTSPAIESVIGG